MDFINQPGSQTLLSGIRSTYHHDIFVACGGFCLRNGPFNAVSDEAHRQFAVLLWQLLWNRVRQDKDRHLIFVGIRECVRVSHSVGTPAHHHCSGCSYFFLKHLSVSQCFKIRIQATHITIAVIHKPIQ